MAFKLPPSSRALLFRTRTIPLNNSTPSARALINTQQQQRRRAPSATIPHTSIKIFRDTAPLRQWRRAQLHAYRSVGLVPTMGALHAGHLSLIRSAAAENSHVVVSLYVNPTQFGVHEDLDSYPQTWEADCRKLAELDRELAADGAAMGKIAAVFAPTTPVMYPSGPPGQEVHAKGSFVTITPVGERLEGASRPTFFRGVATVCMKLFNIVQPERVYFGQKDVQQTVVIKKMVKDFCMDTHVIVGETTREADGLAMSSRNVYLGARRRKAATALSQVLSAAATGYRRGGKRSREAILGPAAALAQRLLAEQHRMEPSRRVRLEIDYLSMADPETMEELEEVDEMRGAILSGAVKMLPVEDPQPGEDLGLAGGPPVRLIDNIILEPVHQ